MSPCFVTAVDQVDNCNSIQNADQKDLDRDDVGDVCDNCPEDSNKNQEDKDGDGVGNACNNCRLIPNKDQRDSDNDGVGDACDSQAQTAYYPMEGGDYDNKMTTDEDEKH